VTLPYSPEFKPVSSEEGQTTLAHLAQATGGKERIELSGVWKDLPRRPRLIELAPWLLMLAVVLLLVEVLERHTGLLSARLLPVWQRERGKIREAKPVRLKRPRSDQTVKVSEPASPQVDGEPQQKAEQAEPAAIRDALRQARQQAKERTKR
jgi:hypothetical protein